MIILKLNGLSFLLVIAIILQSFAAVSDSQETHQINSQHLQVVHSHDLDDITNIIETDNTNNNSHKIDDCHHCGHCQGAHTQWISSKKSPEVAVEFTVFNHYFYLDAADNLFCEQLNRPPIS